MILPPSAIDLGPLADTARPLANPDKGWFHHQYDDHRRVYPATDAQLRAIPGLDHLYFRIPWADLEPEKGKIRWEIIEDWAAKGYAIGFGVVAKETNNDSAVPTWVGAKGTWTNSGWSRDFEPDPDDPTFLAAYADLHRRLAARWGKKKWLRYVDLRSYGDWGEGHTSFGSKTRSSVAVLSKHLRLLRAAWPKAWLTASDDYVRSGVPSAEFGAMDRLFRDLGFSYRDDSVLVRYYADTFPASGSLASPELFRETWRDRPTVLELQHYGMMTNPEQDHTWRGPNGSERGAAELELALATSHASYVGYHGWAADWIRDNPNAHVRFLNRMGYHLRPVSLRRLPDAVEIVWRNDGVAAPYVRYPVRLRIGSRVARVESDTRRWLPGETTERYAVTGDGAISVRVGGSRTVELALREELRSKDGFYRLTPIGEKRSRVPSRS